MYLDPNFGSLIIQIIIGLIAGVGAYLLLIRKQLSLLLFKKNGQKHEKLDKKTDEVNNESERI
jgi:hypothetical protein